MAHALKMEGKVFGMLTVLNDHPIKKGTCRSLYWNCKCICGKTVIVNGCNLRGGNTKSCGCLRITNGNGIQLTPEYTAWLNMKQRCFNKKIKQYHNYGGRGITVCDRWAGKNGFEFFLKDMGKKPTPSHSLDRYPNNDGNYEPLNCRWATVHEQLRNRSDNVFYTINGVSKIMADWALVYKISLDVVTRRVYRSKWGIEKSLTTPIKIVKKK